MWFKDIATWSQKKLRTTFWIYKSIYFVLILLVPVIIVATRYQLIRNASTRLTGIGLILVICFAVYAFEGIKNFVNNLAEVTKPQQLLKFNMGLVFALIVPILVMISIRLIKQNVNLACDTIVYSMFSIIGGIVIEYVAIKYLEAERTLRKDAQKKLEVDKRVEILKK